MVRAGDALFSLDARPYRVRRDQAAAEVTRSEAVVQLAERDLERAHRLLEGSAISAEEFERRSNALTTARASLAGARASLADAELNLGFTQLRVPFDGRVGRGVGAGSRLRVWMLKTRAIRRNAV